MKAPPWVRGVFDHAWAPMTVLAQRVSNLPAPLLDTLQTMDRGYVLIAARESRYVPGPNAVRHLEVRNVAFVSIEDLAAGNERPLHVIGHLVDHHLGCAGTADGAWLSEGGGISLRLQHAGARLPGLFALGYGVDEVAQSGIRDYFAQSLAVYCQDPRRLNVADPQIHKWFRTTLWNAGFWPDAVCRVIDTTREEI